MAKFRVIKTIKLDYLGEEWKDCYLKFTSPTFPEIQEMLPKVDISDKMKGAKAAIEWLKTLFVEGKAIEVSGNKVDVKKDDLADFPIEIINKIFEDLKGSVNPNL